MTRESSDAQQIYQYLLDVIGDAINERDFEKYRCFFDLPHRFETFDAVIVIETEDQLRRIFDATCQRLQSSGVVGFIRTCTIANFNSDTEIKGSHETRSIDGRNRIVDNYTALSTLKLFGDEWRVTDSQYAEPVPSLPTGIVRGHSGTDRKNDV